MSAPIRLPSFFQPVDPAVRPPRGRVRCVVDKGCTFVSSYRSPTLRKHLVRHHRDNDLVLRYIRQHEAKQGHLHQVAAQVGTKLPKPERRLFLNERAALAVLLDGRPPEDLHACGMLQLLSACEPGWTPPSPRTMVEECIPAAHAVVKAAVAAQLHAAPFLTIAFGAWARGGSVAASVVAFTPRCTLPLGVFRDDSSGQASARDLLESVLDGDILAPHLGKVCAVVSNHEHPAQEAREAVAGRLGCLSLRCHARGVWLLADRILQHASCAAVLDQARDLARRLRAVAPPGVLLPSVDEPGRMVSTLHMLQSLLRVRGGGEEAEEEEEESRFWHTLEGVAGVLEALTEWQEAVWGDEVGLADLFHHYSLGWGQRLRTRAKRIADHLPDLSRAVMQAVADHQEYVCPHAATAAYYLDPRFAGAAMAPLPNEAGIRQGVLQSHFRKSDQRRAAEELEAFVAAGRAGLLSPVSEHFTAWWSDASRAEAWPTLQPVARRLLACRVHAASCEGLWTVAARVPRSRQPDPELRSLNAVVFTRLNAEWVDGGGATRSGEAPAATRRRAVGGSMLFSDLVAAAATARFRLLSEVEEDIGDPWLGSAGAGPAGATAPAAASLSSTVQDATTWPRGNPPGVCAHDKG